MSSKARDLPSNPIDAELPEGWAVARLGDGLVRDIQPGFACGAHNRGGEGMPHLRPMNISREGRIDLSDLKFISTEAATAADRWVRAGDVLFNNTNSPELVGKTAVYDLPEPRAFSNHMTRLRVREDTLDARYCATALHAKWQEGYFQAACNNHVSQASVSREAIRETSIALPPLAEQGRIVARLQELSARVDAARERLVRVPAILKRLRQAILAAAFSGQLTADWRVGHNCPESGEQLLARIDGEQRIDAKNRSKKLKINHDFDDDYFRPEVPETWAYCRAEEVCDFITKGTTPPSDSMSGGVLR